MSRNAQTPRNNTHALISGLVERAASLTAASDAEQRSRLQQELQELSDRAKLAEVLAGVKTELVRLQELAKLEQVSKDLDTTALSRKAAELSGQVITGALADALTDELKALDVARLQVKITQTKGTKGKTFHKLELHGASGVPPASVLSEGEHRAVALASFLADLALIPSQSAIVLDDPVSSLDHRRRGLVAKRIVKEAKKREVVVFTHDLAFLLLLHETAEREGLNLHENHIRVSGSGPGQTVEGSPWAGLNTGKRLGALRSQLQFARAVWNKDRANYDRIAISTYGLLREAWERAIEEVALNGVVTRFGREIQTKKLRAVTDLAEQDYMDLDEGMSRCSKFFAGHDNASELNEPVPEPDELAKDISALDSWVDRIRKRRK